MSVNLTEFIRKYEELELLWNPQHVDNSNLPLKNQAYLELLEVMQKDHPEATIDDVKRKINSLRTTYRLQKRKLQVAKESGRSYIPKSWSYPAMQFLDNIKESDKSVKEERTLSDNRGEKPQQSGVGGDEKSRLFTRRPNLVNRKRKLIAEDILEKAALVLAGPEAPPIALAWGEKLMTLRQDQRVLAEKFINDILFEASMNSLSRFSVSISNQVEFVEEEDA